MALAPVSLPLASADGARRKTAKGKLLENLSSLEDREINIETLPTSQKVYILDHVASIRTIVKVPNTFEDLALILLNGIPKNVSNNIYCLRHLQKEFDKRIGKVTER